MALLELAAMHGDGGCQGKDLCRPPAGRGNPLEAVGTTVNRIAEDDETLVAPGTRCHSLTQFGIMMVFVTV